MSAMLSIVTTLYQSAPYLQEFYERVTRAALEITDRYDVIMVNDGSPDESLTIALELQKSDPRLTIIDLSRNFGHHRAIMTGLQHARGEYVFLIDSDLEEAPELLSEFWDELRKEKSADSICGVQIGRKGTFFERISGSFFNKAINFISGIPIPENVVLVRLMRQKYVAKLILHAERELTFVGIVALTGCNQKYIEIQKSYKGTTTYTLLRKINLAFNYITSLSSGPLESIFYAGLIITLCAFTAMLLLIIRHFFSYITLGWTSLIISIWLVGGIIIFFLGILAIYVSKIFIEVKNRPYTIIKDIYKR